MICDYVMVLCMQNVSVARKFWKLGWLSSCGASKSVKLAYVLRAAFVVVFHKKDSKKGAIFL